MNEVGIDLCFAAGSGSQSAPLEGRPTFGGRSGKDGRKERAGGLMRQSGMAPASPAAEGKTRGRWGFNPGDWSGSETPYRGIEAWLARGGVFGAERLSAAGYCKWRSGFGARVSTSWRRPGSVLRGDVRAYGLCFRGVGRTAQAKSRRSKGQGWCLAVLAESNAEVKGLGSVPRSRKNRFLRGVRRARGRIDPYMSNPCRGGVIAPGDGEVGVERGS